MYGRSIRACGSLHPLNNPIETAPVGAPAWTVDHQVDGNELKWLHIAAAGLCAVGFAIDLSEISMGSALSAIFSNGADALQSWQLTALLVSVYVGAIVGAPLFGWIADRLGARTILGASLVWLGVSSALAGCSTSITELTVARCLSGIALGAFPPLMIAYLTDIAPEKRRGFLIFFVCALAYLGPPLVIFSIRALTPSHPYGIDGWRWPLLAGGCLSVLTGISFRALPQAPRWLEAIGRHVEAATACKRLEQSPPVKTRRLAADGTSAEHLSTNEGRETPSEIGKPRGSVRTKVASLSAIYILSAVATVAFPLLTGPLLLSRGISLSDTLFYVGIGTLGPCVGTLGLAFLVDRLPRRSALIAAGGAMFAAVLLVFATNAPPVLIAGVFGFGICTAVFVPVLTTYGAEMFGPVVRARATSTAWAANRLGAVLAPLALLPLLHSGHGGAVEIIVVLALVAMLSLIALRPAGQQST